MGRGKKIWMDVVLPLIGITILALSWVAMSSARPDLFATPSATFDRFLKLLQKPISRISLAGHIWNSIKRVLVGLVFAWVLGIGFGILIGYSRKANALLGSVFEIIRPIPPLAWIPLITIWFGIGEFPKIVIVFIGTFATVALNTCAGIQMVDDLYLNVGKVFHASNRQMLMEIALPAALPSIFAGIRISTGAGWMAVLAAEMLGAKSGVGFLITRGMDSGDTALIFVSMIIIGVIGAILAVLTSGLERWLCPWSVTRNE